MSTKVKNTQANSDVSAINDVIFLPDRDAKVAELAYYKAESRGFEPGYELEDWLAAEGECSL
jgi:Protein of unknown function (DUF2934)